MIQIRNSCWKLNINCDEFSTKSKISNKLMTKVRDKFLVKLISNETNDKKINLS